MSNYTIGQKYILLALSADSLFGKGKIVDVYHGDQKLLLEVPSLTVKQLKYDLTSLLDEIESNSAEVYPYFTKTFLLKQVVALSRLVDIYSGIKVPYREAIRSLLDIDPCDPNIPKIQNLKVQIADLLTLKGYRGSISEMLSMWRHDGLVDSDGYIRTIKELSRNYSRQTYDLISKYILSEDESAYIAERDVLEFEVEATEENWSAYNYYHRDYRGKVVFNSRGQFNKYRSQTFVAHEAYPGHHTSCLLREFLVNKGELDPGASIHLLTTPECTIAEGLADWSINFLKVDAGDIDFQIEHLMDELAAEVDYLAAIRTLEENAEDSSIIQLLLKEKLMSNEDDATQSLKFVKSWGYYVPTYKFGRQIVGKSYEEHKENVFKVIYGACCPTILKRLSKNVAT